MASKSCPLAFLPSPATTVLVAGNENFPPLSPTQATLLETTTPPLVRPSILAQAGLRRTPPDAPNSKGCFSPSVSPNYHPLTRSFSNPAPRPPYPNQPLSSPRLSATSSGIIPTSFVDQSRAFVEQQRHVFEQERLLFAQERELWEMERLALHQRIRELELALAQLNHQGTFGNTGSSGSLRTQAGQIDTGEKFWEGSSSHKGSATRAFSPPPKPEGGRLSSIPEGGSIRQGKNIERPYPRNRRDSESSVHFLEPTPQTVGNGIDISLIEKGLDGISIKASSLPPAILAKVRSPPPPEDPDIYTPSSGQNSSSISPGGLFKLKKDAGHTPPAHGRYSIEDSEQATPKQPEHLHRPSVAYPFPDDLLSDSPVEADPSLAAPLGITNNDEKDAAFLNQLDSKLLQEARKSVSPSEMSSSSEEDTAPDDIHQPEPEVKIRFKRSINFGSAFGSTGF